MSARTVNKVILIGNLGRDAETKHTPSGTAVTRFSLATTRRRFDSKTEQWQEETNWTQVVAWDQESVAEYLRKGKQVYVEGRLQTRRFEQEGQAVQVTEVVAHNIVLLGIPGESDRNDASATVPPATGKSRTKGRSALSTHNEEDLAAAGIPDQPPF